MSSAPYRFQVGAFDCAALSDGSFTYPLESFFANAPPGELHDALERHHLPLDHIVTPYTCLFVDTGEHRVLIDTGAGNLAESAAMIFPSVDHSGTVTGTLMRNLRRVGWQPDDVDTVIFTHAHPDHIGGTLTDAGALRFPRAHYFIHKDEWTFWTSDEAAQTVPAPMVQVARDTLLPLRDRLTLVEDGLEVTPGIRVTAAPGHTPGHIALEIGSAGERLLHISDVVLHPLHLEHPTWVPVFDLNPEQAAESKQRIFDRAAADRMLLFAHHFPPYPNLGHVRRQEDGWIWLPIDTEA